MLYTQTLNRNKDFLFLYRKGKSLASGCAVFYFAKNRRSYNRFGITAGKKVGNAVMRNRSKRIIREAYRQNELDMPVGVDIVIVARNNTPSLKTEDISNFLSSKCIPYMHKYLGKDTANNTGKK